MELMLMLNDGGVGDSVDSHADEVSSDRGETLSGSRSSQRCPQLGLRVIEMFLVLVVTSDGTDADVE